ncbi:MAG: dihydroorotate dehydrogenase [Planctomycetota bacterium]
MRPDLSVELGPLKLANPVMTASGTCGYGFELEDYNDLTKLGALIPKSITLNPRLGNMPPRLVETPSGLINSIGLQNDGLADFIARKLPKMRKLGCPIIANIAGFDVAEFALMAAELDARDEVAGFEVNISCPNVKQGGVQFGIEPHAAAEVTKAVRKATKKAVIVKLTPNVTDITEIARAVEAEGADAVSLINTLSAMAVDAESRKPMLGNVFGGLSGPCVKPVALRMVYLTHKAVKIPIVGLGGIRTGADAIEFILCGATAVEVGTGVLLQPRACMEVLEGIEDYCVRHGVSKLTDLVGGLKL